MTSSGRSAGLGLPPCRHPTAGVALNRWFFLAGWPGWPLDPQVESSWINMLLWHNNQYWIFNNVTQLLMIVMCNSTIVILQNCYTSLSSLFAESQLLRWTSKSLFAKIPAYCRFLPIFDGEKHATHWMFYFSQRNPKVSEVATGFGSQCLSFKSCNYMIFSVEVSKHRPWTGI